MSRNADDVRQSPTPSTGGEGTDLHSVARQVEGLLDDEGHFNPDGQLSRGHPDYDESTDERARTPQRDERGRFQKAAAADDSSDDEMLENEGDEELDAQAAVDDPDEDDEQREADADTDEDPDRSASDEAQTDDADTGDIQSLDQLAEALELSPDEFKESLTHTFNAAGEQVTVTLAELEKGYQKDADYRRSTAKLAQDRQNAEQEFTTRRQVYEQQNHNLAATLQIAENLVAAELNDPRLAELRESDPAEWTARRDEIGQRLNGLRQARMQAAQAYSEFTNSAMQQLRQREEAALLDKVPDFGKEHRDKAKNLMAEMGFAEQEISQVFDHRLIVGVLELAQLREEVADLREMKRQAEDTTKRIKKDIPKLTKPGKQRRKPTGIKRDNIAKLKRKAAESGSVKDAAKVIENFI